ncbi:MAG: lipopolysaccharide heptosyltransferase I [Nevskia sp.]
MIHTLPAVTDALRHRPGLRLDWLVEKPFAEIPAWHPAVDRVIACDLRGWRQHPGRAVLAGDWSAFRARLRETRYDAVIDAQGLVKSAWLGRQAIGPLHGPDRHSAREPLAALLYRHGHPVPRHDRAHAVERTRRLFAEALAYPLPDLAGRAPDAGLNPATFPAPAPDAPYALLLHGTSWPSKRWPLAHWQALGRWLADTRALRAVLPWGSEGERLDAVAIAEACNGLVLPKLDLTALGGWLAQARVVVGVDTGLMHFAAALGTPGLSLYGPTLPALTGAVGRNQVWLQADPAATTIDRERRLELAPQRVETALAALLATPAV